LQGAVDKWEKTEYIFNSVVMTALRYHDGLQQKSCGGAEKALNIAALHW